MYARTVVSYLLHLTKEGRINVDTADELTRGPLVTHEGKVLYPPAPV
jgi:NAD/NADP transhydrogenase alpha subunit